MDSKKKEELDAIFDKEREEEIARRKRAEEAEKRKDQKRNQFFDVVVTVIKPVFLEFSEYLQERGLFTTIRENGLGDTKANESSIALDFAFEKQHLNSIDTGKISGFRITHYRYDPDKVKFHRSSYKRLGGGISGPGGDHALEKIDRALVEEELMSIIKKTISSGW